MPLHPITRTLLVAFSTLLVAAPLWAALGYLATAPLGAFYGWSGHPALPAAPKWMYVTVYLAVLPVLSLALGWAVVRLAMKWWIPFPR